MEGAIFDVDGTILDSMGVWVDLTKEFFQSHNIIISEDELLDYQNMTFEESIPKIQKEFLPNITFDEMMRELKQLVFKAYKYSIPAKPGVCEYIRSLHNNGVKIAIATSGFRELCTAAFERLGIQHIIDAYAFSSETGCSKSKPDIYLLAAKRLGLKPQECTVYEDIITGIMSANSAGFKTVAIYDKTNARDTQRLLRHSDRYITGWNELLSR